jgi:hypothetical protein
MCDLQMLSRKIGILRTSGLEFILVICVQPATPTPHGHGNIDAAGNTVNVSIDPFFFAATAIQ